MAPWRHGSILSDSEDSPQKLHSLRLSFYFGSKRDSIFTTSEMTPLPARPVNRLSIWAYLGIGVVVFCASVIIGYLVYSCYNSAKKRKPPAGDVADDTRLQVEGKPASPLTEKPRVEATDRRRDKPTVELESLGRGVGHGWSKSESQRKMLQPSETISSKMSFAQESDIAADSYPSSMSPSTEQFSTYLDFHRSPLQFSEPATPVNRSFLDKPFPSSPLSPNSTPSGSPKRHNMCEGPSSWRATAHRKRSLSSTARPRFDSNNIRFVSPLDPLDADPSILKLYNEPKLSPIHGSLFPPTPSTPSTPSSSTTIVSPTSSSPRKSSKWRSMGSWSRSVSEGQPEDVTPTATPTVEEPRSRGPQENYSTDRVHGRKESGRAREEYTQETPGVGGPKPAQPDSQRRRPSPGYF